MWKKSYYVLSSFYTNDTMVLRSWYATWRYVPFCVLKDGRIINCDKKIVLHAPRFSPIMVILWLIRRKEAAIDESDWLRVIFPNWIWNWNLASLSHHPFFVWSQREMESTVLTLTFLFFLLNSSPTTSGNIPPRAASPWSRPTSSCSTTSSGPPSRSWPSPSSKSQISEEPTYAFQKVS